MRTFNVQFLAKEKMKRFIPKPENRKLINSWVADAARIDFHMGIAGV